MHFTSTMSADGLATLAAGVIAFVAVMIQIRFSTKGLEKELREEKNARAREDERQRRSISRALLFEIDGFYMTHLSGLLDALENVEPATIKPLPALIPSARRSFLVYGANAGRLGQLDESLVNQVVHFYEIGQSLVSLIHLYGHCVEHLNRSGTAIYEEQVARESLRQIKNLGPPLLVTAYRACELLASAANVEFVPKFASIAKCKSRVELIEASLQRRFSGTGG